MTAGGGSPGGPFFRSRWVEVPGHVREIPIPAGGTLPLPAGFRASGVACGIKPEGALDLGLLVCDAPKATSAARFGVSGAPAAPVLLCRRRCRLDALRAVVANSGNANAATGGRGLDEAARMQGAGALVARVGADRVAVASTGVIGVQLPGQKVVRGLAAAARELREDGALDFARAIRTTDALDKHAALEVELSGGVVRLCAQAKGAGMISPRFATMLCFVQTDAVLSAATADRLLGVTVRRSFDRVSVDGQLSTNDTAILIASGSSGVPVAPESEDERAFGIALDTLLCQLALLLVADGEGARRVGRVHVRGGDPTAVERAARAVADSPLVKTALHGGDPNWGRIVQAVGAALPLRPDAPEPLAIDVDIEGVPVCRHGAAVAFAAGALTEAVARAEVQYEVTLPGEGAEAEVFFSDLGHGYVTINADYTT